MKKCIMYTDVNNHLYRTRFVKTSRQLENRKQDVKNRSYNPIVVTKEEFEAESGVPINKARRGLVVLKNISLMEPTPEMKRWREQNRKKNGRTIY